VYFTSDTNVIEERVGIEADVLLPPIDGTSMMGRHEADGLVREIGSSLVLPVHYDTDGIEGIDVEPKYSRLTSRPVECDSNGSERCSVVSRALLRR
jgi:L-ascorbate metabolism protein UlaG (beta-lactamase superfamily)